MQNLLFFISLLLLFACKNEQSKNKAISIPKEKPELFPNLQAMKDTLNRFDKLDSLFYSQDLDFNLCIDKFEGKRIGVLSYQGLYVFLRKPENDWELNTIDTLFSEPMYRGLSLVDINGDGFEDIRGKNGFGGHGVTLSYFAIYNPKTKKFKYNPLYDGGYVMYDKSTKLVCMYYDQPTFAHKERYKVIGDSLILIDAVNWYADDYPTNESGKTTHEIYKNGKVISRKTIRTSSQEYFKKTLWDYAQW